MTAPASTERPILIVENDAAFAQQLQQAFASRRLTADIVNDASSALASVKANPPRLVVLCVELQGRSGYSVCNKLKKTREYQDIPIVILSAEATPEVFDIENSGAGTMELRVDGQKVWHAGNDGTGTTLDADLLDNMDSTAFVAVAGDVMAGDLDMDGTHRVVNLADPSALQDAATRADADMGPLYLQALEFVIDNARIFESDLVARELGILAVRLISISGYDEALPSLWEYFTVDDTTSVRIEALSAIGNLAPGDTRLVNNLNRWLSGQNDKLRAGEEVNLDVIEEAVVALGKIGDDSSFPVLFSVSILGHPYGLIILIDNHRSGMIQEYRGDEPPDQIQP